jgi:fermentation-respiration switch protein FrsA (DUF1100 family)
VVVDAPGATRARLLLLATTSVAAWLGLAIGLGIAVPWLADGAVSVLSILGLVALGVGLGAVGLGIWLLVTTRRRWHRLAVVPWFLLLAALTFSASIALAVNVVAPTDNGDRTPADVGLAFTDVELTTADGVTLAGWYVTSANGAAVVIRHGAGSVRASTLDHAAVLARHGYGVLLVDARGHGDSGGRAMDLGWYGEVDTSAAVAYLASRPEVDPDRIAVLGLSMGGEEAIGAIGTDPRIATVVAEGATGRTRTDKDWLSEEYGLAGHLQELLDRVTYTFVDLLTAASPPIDLEAAVIRAAPAPILLIAAGDVEDEHLVAQRLQTAAPVSIEVWVVPGSGHTGGLDTAPAEWERRVVDFLDTALDVDR